jgi:aryl carrier-like protein
MSEDGQGALRRRVERLVYVAAGGRIQAEDLADPGTDLRTVGLDSLGYLNLLEGLERTFGVAVDLDPEADTGFLHSIDGLVRWLAQRGAAA